MLAHIRFGLVLMISTLFLNQYIDFRLSFAQFLELYLIDQVQENEFEILIKDNGAALEGEELTSSKEKIKNLQLKDPDKYYQYFHKGMNNLQIVLDTTKNSFDFSDLYQMIGLLMLQHYQKEFVFTYLSPKGEYLLNSKDFLSNFNQEEINSKEFALYLNELLQDHLSEIFFTTFK